jgi:hypothetical protein
MSCQAELAETEMHLMFTSLEKTSGSQYRLTTFQNGILLKN